MTGYLGPVRQLGGNSGCKPELSFQPQELLAGMIVLIVRNSLRQSPPYSDLWLSLYVSTRMLDQDDWEIIWNKYADYINQLNRTKKLTVAISQIWRERDYTLNSGKIKTAPTGTWLNDDNVKPSSLSSCMTS